MFFCVLWIHFLLERICVRTLSLQSFLSAVPLFFMDLDLYPWRLYSQGKVQQIEVKLHKERLVSLQLLYKTGIPLFYVMFSHCNYVCMCAYWCSSGIHCHIGKCESTANVFCYGIAVDIKKDKTECLLLSWSMPGSLGTVICEESAKCFTVIDADTFGSQIVYISFLLTCTIHSTYYIFGIRAWYLENSSQEDQIPCI